jgi:hypothetical protein
MIVTHARRSLLLRSTVRLLLVALLLAQAVGFGAGLFSPSSTLAADLFTELRTFPGIVLLPPADLEPFTQLEPWRVELNRPRPGSTAVVRGRYLVQYRDQVQDGAGSAQVGGTVGRDELDQTLMALASRSFKRCPADALYCVENVAGQDDAPPASEVFRGVRVGDFEAVVEHVVCCGGHYWSLTWFDSGRDMTYTMVLVGPVADQYGGGIMPENLAVAERIVSIAAQLVPLE